MQNHFNSIDVLINNAGIYIHEKTISELGFEMTYTINHFGHFYLTYSLYDLAKASGEGRIINVSSMGHYMGELSGLDDLACDKGYGKLQVYSNSKMFNVMFTLGLSKRLEEKGIKTVKTASLHPGAVETNLAGTDCLISFLRCFCCCCFVDTTKGARTNIYLSQIPF